MIPILYSKNDQSLAGSGVGFLVDAIKCQITEERNGIYELELQYPTAGRWFGEICEGALVKAKPNDTAKLQYFRIYKSSRPINGKVSFYGEHISYDLSGYPLAGFTAQNTLPKDTISKALTESDAPSRYTVWSDIDTVNSTSIAKPCSVRALLGGQSGSILDVWGGEYEFDNFTVKLHRHRGKDSGVMIRYGKNLQDLKQDRNISECYTHILPYAVIQDPSGTAGTESYIYLAGEKTLQIAEESIIGRRRVYLADLTDRFGENEAIDEASLRVKAIAFAETCGLNVPKVSLTVEFIPLWQTEDYKEIAPLERVSLCDEVSVHFAELGVTAKAKVIKTVYDSLKERFVKTELGDARSNFAKTAAQAKAQAVNTKAIVTLAQSVAETAIKQAEAARNYAVTAQTQAEDAHTTAMAAKIDAEQAIGEMNKLDENLQSLSRTMTAEYARKTDLTEAEASLTSKIEQNAGKIESTVAQMQMLNETANDAALKAATAKENADLASALVTQAQKDLETAEANLASITDRVGVSEAEIAAAQTAVSNAKNAADNAQAQANAAKTAADNAQAAANSLVNRISSAETKIAQNSTEINLRAKMSDVQQQLAGYYTKSETEAAIKVSADAINLGVTRQIAGKVRAQNLIPNSTRIENGAGYWQVNFSTVIGGQTDPFGQPYASLLQGVDSNSFALIPGGKIITQPGTYAFSVWMKANKNTSVHLGLVQDTYGQNSVSCAVTTEWKRFDKIVEVSAPLSHDLVIAGWNTFDTSVTLYIARPMLVYDNQITDWAPSPEDVDARVSQAESSIKINADNIESKVSQNGVVSAINQSAETVKIAASKINLQGAVTMEALDTTTRNTLNSAATTASSAQTAATNASINATNAQASANQAQNDINNLKVGGRNLLPKSKYSAEMISIPQNSKSGYGFRAPGGQRDVTVSGMINGLSLKTNTDYTVSFVTWLDTTDANARQSITWDLWPDNLPQEFINWGISNVPQKFSWVIRSDQAEMANCNFRLIVFDPDAEGYTAKYPMYFTDIQLEEGNKATDWTPAPEDTDANLKQFKDNIYRPGTTLIDGAKIYTESLFSQNITMTGSFTTQMSVFLEPGEEELQAIMKHESLLEEIPASKLHLYDFDGDGRVSVIDAVMVMQVIAGKYSMADHWRGAVNSTVTMTINMADPDNFIVITGTNMWGRKVEHKFATNLAADIHPFLSAIYPVGSVYMTSTSQSPAESFGGSWEQITNAGLSNLYAWKRIA